MRLTTLTRVAIGLLFMGTGFVKTRRFGKRLTPDIYKFIGKEFTKMDKALKDFPGKDSVKLQPAEWQEIFGYVDLICGFLLLTGNLTGLAILALLIEVVGLEYTLFIMNYPIQVQAMVITVIIALVSLCTGGGGKEKQE